MPIDYSKFIFHSSRIPFGSVHTETISLPIGGPVSTSGALKTVFAPEIPTATFSASPRIVYKVPPGTWYDEIGGAIASGTRKMSGGIRVILANWPNGREVTIRPIVTYSSTGIKVGVLYLPSWSGTNPGSITVPSVNLEMTVSLDVIPDNIE